MVHRFARRATDPLAPYVGQTILLAVIYTTVARLGLQLDPVNRFATFVWPPTGVSLAALLLFGPRLWPGIAIGALIANSWTGAPLPVACGIALGNTLEAVVGAAVLRRIPGFRVALDRVVDVLGLVALAALLSTIVSATIGVASLAIGGVVPWEGVGTTWMAWWQGDAIGDLVVAPVLLTWAGMRWVVLVPRRVGEAVALAAALAVASFLLFSGDQAAGAGITAFRQPVTLLPLMIWAALRFGPRGVTGATLLVSAVAVWRTALGEGPFVRVELHQSLALLQAFMGVVAVTFLVLSAVTGERERADRDRVELAHRERLARAHAVELERLRGQGPAPSNASEN